MKRLIQGVDILLVVLLCVCVLLAAALAVTMPVMLIPVVLILVLIGLGVWLNARRIRRAIAKVLRTAGGGEQTAQYGLMSLPLPVMILSGKSVIWYNDSFRDQVLQGEDTCLQPVNKVFPALGRG